MFQPMLFEAEVIATGPGCATVRAHKPILEGDVAEARRVLGGFEVISSDTVCRLIREGKLRAWQPRGGGRRTDGRGSNAKYVVDLASCYRLRAKMLETDP
jgi:hypothetical protein